MKLLDNLVLISFTILVSTVYISKCLDTDIQIHTITTNNSTIIKWTNNYYDGNEGECTSLTISNGSYSNNLILMTAALDCKKNEFNNFYDERFCTRNYNSTANNLNQCTNYTIKIECSIRVYKVFHDLPLNDLISEKRPREKFSKKTFKKYVVTNNNLPLEPIKNILTKIEKNFIQIQWNESTNHKLCIKEYRITLFSENEIITKTTSVYGFLLTNLKANKTYYGYVTAIYEKDKQEINNTIKEFKTTEKFKGPEFNVHAKSEIPKIAEVSWNISDIKHEITYYEIIYYIIDAEDNKGTLKSHNNKDTKEYISSLEPCKFYRITIRPSILNFGNDLSATTKIFVIDTGTCMKLTKDSQILNNFTVDPIEGKQAKLYIPSKLFLSFTEQILNYSILLHIDNGNVPENWPSLLTNEDSHHTWAHMDLNPATVFFYRSSCNHWKPEKDSEDANGNFVFTIGDNNKCSEQTKTIFCNGPLKPKRKYEVAVRACSKRGCVDSSSRSFYAKDSDDGNSDNKSHSYPLQLIFFVTLGSILFVAAVIFMLCTIRVQDYDPMHSIIKKSMPSDITYQQLLTKTFEDMEAEYNLLDEFFKSNPTTYVALFPKNRSKNRYSDILPYDFNRVKLNSDNDYINASFIYDFDNVQKYIACQGPMTNTFEDMWQMVLEQNIVSIVMLCKMIESNKKKCDKYFPDVNEKLKLDGITVENNKTTVSKNQSFSTNKLTIIKGNTQKTINHFQFHDWPDFGTPDEYSILLEFCQNVNAVSSDGLIVVHCSAGVGRTGTYIACDMLLKLMDRSNKLNIFKTVLHLRKQRTNMVQTQLNLMKLNKEKKKKMETNITNDQYNFIYGFLGNFINPYL